MMKYRIIAVIPVLTLMSVLIPGCNTESGPIISVPESEETEEVISTDEDTEEVSITGLEEPEPVTIPYTDIRIIRDVEYARVNGTPLLLDIYVPDKPIFRPMPVVVFIHGGGWQNGDKYPCKVETLAKRGFLGISINYRLSGVATFPAAVEDCKCAIRWIRAHAEEYDIDPDKIGVWGSSAGGHLVMMLGCADETVGLEGNSGWAAYSSRVQAVCSYFGPGDFTGMGKYGGSNETSAEVKFLGGIIGEIPEVYVKASPVTYVSADDPPLLMVHGDKDYVVPFKQSEIMLEAYRKAGLEATLIKVSNAGHGFRKVGENPIEPSLAEIEQAVLDFFIEHLVMTD